MDKRISDMLDLFYANKHAHDRLVRQETDRESKARPLGADPGRSSNINANTRRNPDETEKTQPPLP